MELEPTTYSRQVIIYTQYYKEMYVYGYTFYAYVVHRYIGLYISIFYVGG